METSGTLDEFRLLCLRVGGTRGHGTRGQVRRPDIGMQWDEGAASLSHFWCLLAEDDGLLAVRGSLQSVAMILLAVPLTLLSVE